MAGRIMELAIAIKGRLDGSVTSSMQKAVSESRKLQKQLTQANRAMQEAQKAASAEQKAMGHVSAAQYEHIAFLQGKINALTQRRSDILDAQAKKENAENKFSAATGNLAKGAAVVAAGAAPLAAMIGTAATFEQAMSKVKAITNSSNEDMARLNETAQQLGALTQFSATQAAEAMSYLGMAGWKTDQIIAGMPGMLDLAAASGSDLATVADIVSDDLTAFGMSADQAGHMADVMAAASTNANTNVEMMGMTFKYAGAVAGALGYSLEDVSIATGLMANAGIKADQAGTSLRAIMTRLIDPPKDAATALDALGISAVNADGSVKPFRQTIMELREKFKGLSQSEKAQMASSIAGTEAMSGFLAVVNASDSDFDTLANAIDNADGASKKMADTMNDNAKGSAIQLESAIEGVSIAIGSIFLPTLAMIAGAMAQAVGSVANWAKGHQELVGIIITATAAIAGLIMAVLAINAAAAGIMYLKNSFLLYKTVVSDANIVMRLWAGATKVAAAAQMAFNAVMSVNPIILIIMAILAAVAAFVYFYNTNEKFRNMVISAWNAIKTTASSVWSAIVAAIGGAWEGIVSAAQAGMDILNGIWNAMVRAAQSAYAALMAIVAAFVAAASAVWRVILVAARVVWFAIKAVIVIVAVAITSVMWAMAHAIMAIWQAIGPTVMAVWQGICSAVSSAIRIITGIVENMAMLLSTVWNGIVQAAQFVWNGLVMIVQGVMSAITFIIQGAVAVITAYWTFIAPIYIAIWDAICSAVSMVVSVIVSIVSAAGALIMAVWDAICAVATAVWSAICAVVTMVVSVIMGIVDAAAAMIMAAWDAIYQAAVSAWEAIVGVVQGVIDAVVNTVNEGIAWVEDRWNHLREIFSAPIQAVVNFVKTGSSEAESAAEEQVGESAAGGVFTHPYLTWVAEAGYPEVIVPTRKSARAVSLWQTAGRMLGLVPDGVKTEPAPEAKASSQPVAMPTPRESASSPSVKVSFAPTVNISGQADAGVAEMIRAALAEQKRQFERELPDMLRRARANERRLSYA
ncbi:phage tail tape measure protein [uncultured Mitsuokella sp.]|uniref:phage tail tape measure protein n=1 Tax=uncultured Mitsuokella sp. TaxID=453120 RepID=UPI00267498B4|nr:phage tail tape measure protein [uncultured Mitsuokella sp.]